MNKRTPLGIAATVFIFFLPFVTLPQVFYADISAKFFYVIFAVDLLLLFSAYRLFMGHQVSPRSRLLLFGALGLLGVLVLTALLGVYPERSFFSDIFWSSGVLFLSHLILGAICLAEFLKGQDWGLVRRGVSVSGGIFGLLSIVGIGGVGATFEFLWLNLEQGSLTFGNETYAGVYLLLALILSLVELSRTPIFTKWWYTLSTSSLFIFFSPILLNTGALLGRVSPADILGNPTLLLGSARASSATAILFILFCGGYFLLRRYAPRYKKYTLPTWGALFCLAALLGVALLFTPGSVVQKKYIETSTAARIIVWEAGLEAFVERPIFGWGPENFNFALEQHLDSRLFLDENIGEIWFDRAHNVFVDTLVGVGVVGGLALVVLVGGFVFVVYRARRGGLIGEWEGVLLLALVPAHMLQLQTGFDTIGSFTLLGLIGAYVLHLEREVVAPASRPQLEKVRTITESTLLVILALLSLKFVLLDEFNRQTSLAKMFEGGTLKEQQELMAVALRRPSSFESLRLASASFITGSLASIASESTPEKISFVQSIASLYEDRYQSYLEVKPDHYRARMNYVYLLLIKTALGQNRLGEARRIIKDSYDLSPGNPLTYILASLSELYGGNLEKADTFMKQALAINPNIPLTREAAEYLERQKKQFPSISVIKLINL